jgi:multiple sugar transport system substrate-binding protein
MTSPTRRKLAVTAAVLGASALLISGCSSSAGGGGGDGAVTQFYHQYGEEGVQEAVNAWADDYSDADIDLQWVEGDYAQRVNALLASGRGIDLFEYNAINVEAARQGQYEDLTDLVEPVKDDILPIALKPVTVDGKYYGIPMITDAQLFLYRPSMFEEAGIDVPETWDDLVAAAQALTTDDRKGLFLGNDGGAGILAANLPPAAPGGIIDDENTTVSLDSPELAEALASAHELYDSGSLLMGAPTDWWDPTSFIAGDAAITWQGLWAIPAIKEALGDDVAAFPVPALEGGQPIVGVSQWNQMVAASSSNVDKAKEIAQAQWIDDTDWQVEFSVDYGFHIPPFTEAAAQAEALSDGVAKQIVDYTTDYGWTGGPYYTPAMATALTDAVTRVVVDGADPESELSSAQDTMQGMLDALQ